MEKISLNFYLNKDVVLLAKNLLGKYLFTKIDNQLTGGMIVETESYAGITDKASHAYNNRRTKRCEAMYLQGGIAYVYLCYGMHNLLNVVTNKSDIPHAVLIRAIEPTHGIEIMLKRRNKQKLSKSLTAGPGVLSQALNITQKNNKQSFNSSSLWIEDRKTLIKKSDIISSPRVGVAYAKEDAFLPWRFRIKHSKWTSIAK